jgi:hypothetical protein
VMAVVVVLIIALAAVLITVIMQRHRNSAHQDLPSMMPSCMHNNIVGYTCCIRILYKEWARFARSLLYPPHAAPAYLHSANQRPAEVLGKPVDDLYLLRMRA